MSYGVRSPTQAPGCGTFSGRLFLPMFPSNSHIRKSTFNNRMPLPYLSNPTSRRRMVLAFLVLPPPPLLTAQFPSPPRFLFQVIGYPGHTVFSPFSVCVFPVPLPVFQHWRCLVSLVFLHSHFSGSASCFPPPPLFHLGNPLSKQFFPPSPDHRTPSFPFS